MLDPKVVARLKRGDGAALKSIFKNQSGRLYALAYRLTGHKATADQLVRDVFQDLWKRRDEIDPLVQLEGALMRETFLRAQQLHGGELRVFVPRSADPQLEPILAALEDMDALPRLVYLLFAVDGYDHRDISRILDVSRDTVLMYFGNALESLETVVRQSAY